MRNIMKDQITLLLIAVLIGWAATAGAAALVTAPPKTGAQSGTVVAPQS